MNYYQSREGMTEVQCQEAKEIRRKGKNINAAHKCRKRARQRELQGGLQGGLGGGLGGGFGGGHGGGLGVGLPPPPLPLFLNNPLPQILNTQEDQGQEDQN